MPSSVSFVRSSDPKGLQPWLAFLAWGLVAFGTACAAEPFSLQVRRRIETSEGSGRYHAVTKSETWDPAKTAIIVCDVWDLHHSPNATLRTGELAPRIDALVKEVRRRGGTVLHCPSDTMASYEGHPGRKAAQNVPKAAKLPPEIGKWCYSIPAEERGVYPLDQTDGGEDDDPVTKQRWTTELKAKGRKPEAPWLKEHEAIAIEDGDFVTDKGDEVWSILDARGIENVLMTGVHTNMCVLGRPFGLRRLASNGKNVVLVRDLTDTMYNPARRPYVNHFTGNDLIAEHIEKYVCGTVTSDQVLGGKPFRFKGDDRPHVVIAMSEPEYETERTLPAFAKRHLGKHFKVSLVFGDEKEGNDLPGLEVLKDADLLLVSMRRRALTPEQMKLIRDHVEAGKPVVGIRTASHALSLRGNEPPQGRVTWETFDADVFGGNYTNHYGDGPEAQITLAEGAKGNPILAGVSTEGWTSAGSLYKVSPPGARAKPLLVGTIPGEPAEPVAYSNETAFGGKAFYTSLGHKSDFEAEPFRRLLFNALVWAASREIPESIPDAEAEAAREKVAEETKTSFTVPEDLEWEVVLSEPVVRQPVFTAFDERGRLWVSQYLQYPYPAGLKMLSKDVHWRAVYDKVPQPPPNHVHGADKITIHEDTNGDGTFDSQKTFVEGLSIVTSFARGGGGVWVLTPPYLLFYPDRNNDDVPDSDPEVRLAGFGIEDTHSNANSLRFGPDGWLYACQGSTVSGHVVRPGTDDKPVATMGQLIWRYHPEKRIYEVFAEGGGNAFGLEIDAAGNIYSGHNGGDTRGFHYIQGGYYRKGFEKHGPLSNPYAFGFFEPMKHPPVPRFTHNFVIYEGNTLPAEYRGKLFGVEPLQGQVTLTQIDPVGSTFETHDLDRAVKSSGGKFRPVHITTGPDGAIYVSDMNEQYIAHKDHFEGRIEKETGRIYRLKAKDGEREPEGIDFGKLSADELVSLLDHPNRWHRQTALRVLADRGDGSVVPQLKKQLFGSTREVDGRRPLDRLWALYQLGGLDEPATLESLGHDDPHVRLWAARLACDDHEASPAISNRLAALAESEPDVRVRVQLACSARRLPADACLPIVRGLTSHDADLADAFLPLSVWWAIEAKCTTEPDAVIAFFQDGSLWSRPLVQDVIAERLMRRFASGNRADLSRCAMLLRSAKDDETRKRLLAGFEAAFRGRSAVALPDELVAALAETGPLPLSLRVRQGEPGAIQEAVKRLGDGSASTDERAELAALLGESRPAEALPVLLSLFESAQDAKLRSAALAALAGYGDSTVADALLTALPQRPSAEQVAILSLLVSRADWAGRLVEAVRAGAVPKETVPGDIARRLTLHGDPGLTAAATAIWPELAAREERSPGDVASLQATIAAEGGDPYHGKRLFNDVCGRCHRLFDTGGDVGPDLTKDPRNDLSRLLGAIVAPSAEIREGFEAYAAVTTDGRVIAGLLQDRDEHVVVLRESDGRLVTLRTDEIDEFVRQPKSLMPDGLLDRMTDEEVRDLFSYLRTSQPLNDAAR